MQNPLEHAVVPRRRMRYNGSPCAVERLETRRVLAPMTAVVEDGVLKVFFAPSGDAENAGAISWDGETYRVIQGSAEPVFEASGGAVQALAVFGSPSTDQLRLVGERSAVWRVSISIDDLVDQTTLSAPVSTASGGVAILGTVELDADIATAGSQHYAGPVSLLSSVRINAAASPVRFGDRVDGTGAGGQDLVIETTASTSLAGAVGSTVPLGHLRVLGGGATEVDGGSIRAADIAFGKLSVRANTMLQAESGDIALGAVDGRTDAGVALSLSAFAAIGVTGPVGGAMPLGSLAVERCTSAVFGSTIAVNGGLAGAAADGVVIEGSAHGVSMSSPGSIVLGMKGAGLALRGGSRGSTLAGFTVAGCAGDGILVSGGDYTASVIRACTIIGNSGAGTSLRGAVQGLVLGAEGDGNMILANRAGITIANGSRDVVVVGGRISGNYGIGVHVEGVDTSQVVLDGCQIGTPPLPFDPPEGNAAHGILVGAATGVQIKDCTVVGSGMFGVVLTRAARNTYIQGSSIGYYVSRLYQAGNAMSGLWIQGGATGTVIAGSSFCCNGYAGIQLSDGSTFTEVGRADAPVDVRHNPIGMTFAGDVSGTRVANCSIQGNTYFGVYANSAQGLLFGSEEAGLGNTVSSSGTLEPDQNQGVVIGGDLRGTSICGSAIICNPGGGVVLINARDLHVAGNRIRDNVSYGVFVFGDSTGTVIQGNEITNASGYEWTAQSVGVWLCEAKGVTLGSHDGLTVYPDTAGNDIRGNASVGIVVDGRSIDNVVLSNRIRGNAVFGSVVLSERALATTPLPGALSATSQLNDTLTFRMPATTPMGSYRVQVFRTAAANVGGSQGEVLLATRDVAVTATSEEFTIGSLAGILAGDRITLTATRLDAGLPRETSAFSSALTAG